MHYTTSSFGAAEPSAPDQGFEIDPDVVYMGCLPAATRPTRLRFFNLYRVPEDVGEVCGAVVLRGSVLGVDEENLCRLRFVPFVESGLVFAH
jgi:hypothetical protein